MRRKIRFGEREMTEDLGGQVAEEIRKLQGLPFVCALRGGRTTCNSAQPLDSFRGYRHADGLSAADGTKHWVYWTCPGCNHDWYVGHIQARLSQRAN